MAKELQAHGIATPAAGEAPVQFVDTFPPTEGNKVHLFPAHLEEEAPQGLYVYRELAQDPQFPLALAGGVTTLMILPGSANLFGGRGVTLKNIPGRTVMEMKFPGAPHSPRRAHVSPMPVGHRP